MFFGIDAFGCGVVKDARRGSDILGKKFLKPFLFDDGGEAKDGVDGFVFAFDFADFGDDEQVAVMDDAFAGECAAAAMNEFAAECAGIDATANAIAEADENAFVERFILNFARGGFEAFAFGDVEELLKEGTDLTSGDCVNAEPAAGIDSILVARGVGPGAHENPKIASGFFAEKIFAVAGGGFVDVAKEKVAALGERGDEARLVNAAVVMRGEEHAGVARVKRESEHFAAEGSDA